MLKQIARLLGFKPVDVDGWRQAQYRLSLADNLRDARSRQEATNNIWNNYSVESGVELTDLPEWEERGSKICDVCGTLSGGSYCTACARAASPSGTINIRR